MDHLPTLFQELVTNFSCVFTSTPTQYSLLTITLGWILCSRKRTMTGIIRAAGTHATKSHDAYQGFFSKAHWDMETLWQVLADILCTMLPKEKPILLVGDDSLIKHYGRKIWGAGLYRDAVRSSKKYPAYAWGLNWVVLAMVVELPFLRGHRVALPIMARLNPKAPPSKKKGRGSVKKHTTVSLMSEMIHRIATRMPERQFIFCGDGAYASVAKQLPVNVQLVSRIRKDAALFARPAPKKTHRPGRPRKKGKRLPSPKDTAPADRKNWFMLKFHLYGKLVRRQVFQFQALWYEVSPDRPVNIIIVRNPQNPGADEFFFTTDLALSPAEILYIYTGRWPIEVVFRESKQYLGIQDSQARKQQAVLRTTPFCLWLNSLIKVWFILEHKDKKRLVPTPDPWYPSKTTVSFQDMLNALRRTFWSNLFSTTSTSDDNFEKLHLYVINSLSNVA
jgi:hypothetical protein